MVDYKTAKELFEHTRISLFRLIYEYSEEKGRRRCFETNNVNLENWSQRHRGDDIRVLT